jgi:hypothetical protein
MPSPDITRKKGPRALLFLSIILSAGGLAAYIYLFVPDFNVYSLILAPAIIALYQVPAAFVFWLYKRKREARDEKERPGGDRSESGQP